VAACGIVRSRGQGDARPSLFICAVLCAVLRSGFQDTGGRSFLYSCLKWSCLKTGPARPGHINFVGKTEDHHLTGIALSNTNERYTIGKVSPNALQTCTHFRSSYSVTRVIRQKVSNLTHNRKRTFLCGEYLLTRPH